MQRFWQIMRKHVQNHTSIVKEIPNRIIKDFRIEEEKYRKEKSQGKIFSDEENMYYGGGWGDEELTLAYYDSSISNDLNYFPEYLRAFIVTFCISLLENLLFELSKIIAQDLNIPVRLPNTRIPFINKYLHFFTANCGLDIQLTDKELANLNAIREVRNRFIHEIDRKLPEEIENVIKEMNNTVTDKGFKIEDEFVDSSMQKISSLVKSIELAYINFFESENNINRYF